MKKLAKALSTLACAATRRRRAMFVLAAALAIVSVQAGIVWAGGSTKAGAAGPAGGPAPAAALTSSRALVSKLALLGRHVTVGHSYKNDVSRPLSRIPAVPVKPSSEREASPNPKTGRSHRNAPDGALQTKVFAPRMPGTTLNFDGILFPGVGCNCAPPDTNGEVGATQYVQIVNIGFQVFNKTTGASIFGPVDIATLWSGFGGACENGGAGDPIVLYDQLANRWIITQFATPTGDIPITDECVAVSATSDATGTWNRYGFHLGSNFFDYPKLGVWPDAYYMSMNVFNSAGTAYLGPEPFAFDRAAMLVGNPAKYVTTGITGGASEDPYLPADLDGSTLPPSGAPDSFVEFPGNGHYKVYRFHVDWGSPGSSTFTLQGSPSAAAFTQLCPTNPSCVPQLGTADGLDALADRMMFRATYRNFGDHESLVTNYTVSSNSVARVRWLELRSVTSGSPSVFQESTYQPDTTWRWMGSIAEDNAGDMALGFSASDATIHPQIRYTGRLVGDPANTMGQGEATLFSGAGSQTGTNNRWGDYSDMTVDPVDDCTFWYTQEYYSTNSSFNWRTRIGNFKFSQCTAAPPPPAPSVVISKSADATSVTPGNQIGYTVTIANVGTASATGLGVTDNLPGGTGIDWSIASGADWSIAGSPPNQHLAYSQTTLAAGASTQVHVVSSTTSGSCGTYNNVASFVTANDGSGSSSASETVSCATCAATEGFDDVGSLPGWYMQNNSDPLGVTDWFQGNNPPFPAQSGAEDSYIGANYNNTSDGTISNWLLTAPLLLHDGNQFIFWTRKAAETPPFLYPDRLQVRMSTNGFSTNVGTTATDVGDFTHLLLDINPTYSVNGYPYDWTRYAVTVSGAGASATGRLVFRYFVENGGPDGVNSNYIGIDTVSFDCTSTPPAPPPPPPPPPPQFRTLTVAKAGSGTGTVTSSPAGISCGPSCTAQFSNGSSVTLTEAPASGSRFTGWSGDCSGTGTCVLSMTADHSVTAGFAKKPKCHVPKVVGLKLAKAKAKIRNAHCGVGKVTKKFSSLKKKGRVLSQKPKPGKTLPAGSRVSMKVGKGHQH